MASWQDPKKAAPATADKKAASWDDKLADALPKRAQYYGALRTQAFVNQNMVQNYAEFWTAFQVDKKNDLWRVMHYMVSDLNLNDGKFVAEPGQKDVSFLEAVAQLANNEYLATKMMTHIDADMAVKYPPDLFPELKIHYFDIDHYRDAANNEGIAFDEFNDPYRRVDGKIFANATFKRSEVAKSILSVEQGGVDAGNKMEAGLLSDIFNTSSARAATLDGILRIGECLATMDNFASAIGAFYLNVQYMAGNKATYDAIDFPTPDMRKSMLAMASNTYFQYQPGSQREALANACETLEQAVELLEEAADKGVHVEPFRKFVAECDVYVHMLNASRKLPELEKGLHAASATDIGLITEIRDSITKAQKKFIALGGTEEQTDKIKAWIANPAKDAIPGWLPGFLTRYYTARSRVMEKVQARTAGARDVQLMSTSVKPPLTDESPKKQKAPGQG